MYIINTQTKMVSKTKWFPVGNPDRKSKIIIKFQQSATPDLIYVLFYSSFMLLKAIFMQNQKNKLQEREEKGFLCISLSSFGKKKISRRVEWQQYPMRKQKSEYFSFLSPYRTQTVTQLEYLNHEILLFFSLLLSSLPQFYFIDNRGSSRIGDLDEESHMKTTGSQTASVSIDLQHLEDSHCFMFCVLDNRQSVLTYCLSCLPGMVLQPFATKLFKGVGRQTIVERCRNSQVEVDLDFKHQTQSILVTWKLRNQLYFDMEKIIFSFI